MLLWKKDGKADGLRGREDNKRREERGKEEGRKTRMEREGRRQGQKAKVTGHTKETRNRKKK